MLTPAELEKQMSQVGCEAVGAVDVWLWCMPQTLLLVSSSTVMKVPGEDPPSSHVRQASHTDVEYAVRLQTATC